MTINNPNIYNAALNGLAGGVQNQRWLDNTNQTAFEDIINLLTPIAAAIDTAITIGATDSEAELMQSISQSVISSRYPISTVDVSKLVESIVSYWTLIKESLVPNPGADGCVSVLTFTNGSYHNITGINLALAYTGATEICFPPGVYTIDGALISNIDNRIITFQAGAILDFTAAGSLSLNGINTVINGDFVVRFSTTSTATFTAVDVHGVNSLCENVKFEVNVNVANCTLIQLSGNNTRVGPVIFTGVGSFKRGVNHATQADAEVPLTSSGPVYWQMTDDGITTRNYDSVVRMRASRSTCNGLLVEHGGRQLINAIFDDAGQHNYLHNPQINSSAGANFAILMPDNAEFLDIYGGEIVGNYLANSVGIQCGDGSVVLHPATGQLKCYGTKIRNWDIGVKITGSSDTPEFFGGAIANNKTAHVQIDSKRGADVWPISGLGFFGVYSEEVAFPGCPFLHLKSGDLLGGILTGCEIGYTGTAVIADVTMGLNIMEIAGNRLPAAAPTDAFTTPNTGSQFFFGLNATSGSNLISKGAFAAKATSIFDQVCTSILTASLKIGTAADIAITKRLASFATANFAAGVPANDQVSFAFSFPGVLTTDYLNWCINGTAAANTSLTFFAFIDSAGSVTIRATNTTAVAVPAVIGTFLFQAFRGFS